MKISSISPGYTRTKPVNKYLKKKNQNTTSGDTFKKQINFKSLIHIDKLNLKKMSNDEITKYAEVYYKQSEETLKNFCSPKLFNKDLNKQTYQTFLAQVNKVRNKMENLEKEINELGSIIVGDSYDTINQKRIINVEFFKMIEAEKRGLDIEIPNGIMIYGDSKKGIEELTNWVKNTEKVNIKEMEYAIDDPMASIVKMYDEAEKAEKLYQVTGKRTILHIENLDELLTDHDTIQKRSLIGRFKMFIEHASKKFHTTILMTTQKDLNDFEEASIGDHRFNIKARINKKTATIEEKKKYKKAKAEYERITKAEKEYWEKKPSYSNNDSYYNSWGENYYSYWD